MSFLDIDIDWCAFNTFLDTKKSLILNVVYMAFVKKNMPHHFNLLVDYRNTKGMEEKASELDRKIAERYEKFRVETGFVPSLNELKDLAEKLYLLETNEEINRGIHAFIDEWESKKDK